MLSENFDSWAKVWGSWYRRRQWRWGRGRGRGRGAVRYININTLGEYCSFFFTGKWHFLIWVLKTQACVDGNAFRFSFPWSTICCVWARARVCVVCVRARVLVRAACLDVELWDKQFAPFYKMSCIHGDSCLQQIPFLGFFLRPDKLNFTN